MREIDRIRIMGDISEKLDGLFDAAVKREEEEKEEEENAERKQKDRQFNDVKPEVSRIDVKAEINDHSPYDQILHLIRERIPGKIRRMLWNR